VFKAQFPIAGAWLDFADIELTIGDERFVAACRPSAPDIGLLLRGSGRWAVVDDEVVISAYCIASETFRQKSAAGPEMLDATE
jgi:hypothetical protein